MSSRKNNAPSDEFLKMFDALLLIDSAAEAKDLVRHSELIENLEFHEVETEPAPESNESTENETEEAQ